MEIVKVAIFCLGYNHFAGQENVRGLKFNSSFDQGSGFRLVMFGHL